MLSLSDRLRIYKDTEEQEIRCEILWIWWISTTGSWKIRLDPKEQVNIFTDSHTFKRCTNSNIDSYFVNSILKEKHTDIYLYIYIYIDIYTHTQRKREISTLIDTVNVCGGKYSVPINHGLNTTPRFPNMCRNFSEGLIVCLVVDFYKLTVIIIFTFMNCDKYCDVGTVSCHLAECVLDFNAQLASLIPINLLGSFSSRTMWLVCQELNFISLTCGK